jgi:6-phosphofructokinase
MTLPWWVRGGAMAGATLLKDRLRKIVGDKFTGKAKKELLKKLSKRSKRRDKRDKTLQEARTEFAKARLKNKKSKKPLSHRDLVKKLVEEKFGHIKKTTADKAFDTVAGVGLAATSINTAVGEGRKPKKDRATWSKHETSVMKKNRKAKEEKARKAKEEREK